jgi:hypothetical protein
VESTALARFAVICASDDILAPENGNAAHARKGGAAFWERGAPPEFRIAEGKKPFGIKWFRMKEM